MRDCIFKINLDSPISKNFSNKHEWFDNLADINTYMFSVKTKIGNGSKHKASYHNINGKVTKILKSIIIMFHHRFVVSINNEA